MNSKGSKNSQENLKKRIKWENLYKQPSRLYNTKTMTRQHSIDE